MAKFFWVLCALFSVWLAGWIADAIIADYSYSREVQSFWELSVKASTIERKLVYLDQYVEALPHAGLADSSALWLKTPDNSVEPNMVALRSLQGRMHDIAKMNVSSFEYQQAMAQITGQEQNEAERMLKVFEEAWYINHHFFLWSWMGIISFVGLLCGAIVTAILAANFNYWST
jgi:hypothetical protein